MNRNDYMNLLKRLPLQNPTLEDLQAVAPHLTEAQVRKAFTPKENESSAYVAVPPIKVKRGHLVVRYSTYDVPSLEVAFARRTLDSYADHQPHGDVFYDSPFQEEAMAYAEQNWGDSLVLDTWADFGRIQLDDPTDLAKSSWFKLGSPRTKYVIYWTVRRGWNTIINEHHKPLSVLWNDELVEVTLNHIESMELRGGRGGFHEFNCANCGGGLGLNCCTSCGNKFDDNGSRGGWGTPLPQRVIDLLTQAGHKFGVSPSVAQNHEQLRWQEYVARWGTGR